MLSLLFFFFFKNHWKEEKDKIILQIFKAQQIIMSFYSLQMLVNNSMK